VGTLLTIYLESCAGPNVMIQQVIQRIDKAGQDSCSAHSLTLEASSYAELDYSSGPTCGFVAFPEVGPRATIGTL